MNCLDKVNRHSITSLNERKRKEEKYVTFTISKMSVYRTKAKESID